MAGPNPIYVDFVARGVPEVLKAIQTVTDAIMKSGAAYTQVGKQSQQAAVAGTAVFKAQLKAQEQAVQETARRNLSLAQQVARKENQIRLEVLRGVKNAKPSESPQAQLAVLRSAQTPDAQRAALNQVAEMRARAQASNREARERASALEEGAKRELALKERIEGEKAVITRRWQMRAENEEFTRRKQFAQTVLNAGGTAVKNATTIAGTVAKSVVGGALAVGGGFSLTDAVERRVRLRGTLADVANRGVIRPDMAGGSTENAKKRSVDELQGAVNEVGTRWGIDPEKAAAGLDKFAAKTGNLQRGLDLMQGLAEMSRSGAGSLDDLADAAGDVFNNDKTQNAEQVLTVMRALAGQGKIGAVEMKDLATQMAALQAAAGRFQGDAGKNMALMGGLAQLSRESGGSRSPAQATQAVTALTAQLYKEKRLEALAHLGVQTRDEKTGFNLDLDKILIGALRGAEKRSREQGHGMRDFDIMFTAAFKDQQAQRAVMPLMKAYKAAGGGEQGAQAAEELLKKYAGATNTKEEVTNAARDRMKEADAQLEIALVGLRKAAGDELTPSLVRLTKSLVELTPMLGRLLSGLASLVEWASSHPFAGFAALITASFLKEIAAAKIGDIITRTVTQSVAGAGPNGVGGLGGAATGGASAAEMGLIGLGTAVQVAGIANLADETYGAISSGKGAAEAMAKDWNSDDSKKRGAARYAYSQAENLQDKTEGSTALAWADRASKMAMWVANPFGAAAALGGEMLGDKAGGAINKARGGEGVGTSASKLAVEALKANEIVNAPELQKLVTASIAAGVKDGVAQATSSVADPSNPKRGQSVTKRTGE